MGAPSAACRRRTSLSSFSGSVGHTAAGGFGGLVHNECHASAGFVYTAIGLDVAYRVAVERRTVHDPVASHRQVPTMQNTALSISDVLTRTRPFSRCVYARKRDPTAQLTIGIEARVSD